MQARRSFVFWATVGVVVLVSVVVYLSRHKLSHQISPSEERLGASYMYPPAEITGVRDQRVTQDSIYDTICQSGYTHSVRPSSTVTSRIKRELMISDKLEGVESDYELDHFIPLELGGCADCPSNLWMEPYAGLGARAKDRVENYLNHQVCGGQMSLAEAQDTIVHDWYAVYVGLEEEGSGKHHGDR
jgi:hypothetical protein